MLSKALLGAIAAGVAGVAAPAVVMAATAGHQASHRAAMPAVSGMRGSGGAGHAHGRVHVILRNADGAQIGYVNLTSSDGATLVSVHAWGLAPGFHGFHIHSMGVCNPDGPAPFESAGGHFNPTGTAEGMQAGAFPVLLANADGTAAASFRDGNVTLKQLFGPSGSSIVVHAMPDNYANIPPRYTSGGVAGPDMETQMTGDGGTRVACGVIAAPAPGPGGSASPAPMMPAPVPAQPTPTMSAPPTSQPTPAPTGTAPMPTPAPPPTGTPTPSPGPTHF